MSTLFQKIDAHYSMPEPFDDCATDSWPLPGEFNGRKARLSVTISGSYRVDFPPLDGVGFESPSLTISNSDVVQFSDMSHTEALAALEFVERCIGAEIAKHPKVASPRMKRVHDAAQRLVDVMDKEISGVRDGDGYWHGSDVLDYAAREMLDALLDAFYTPRGDE